MTDVRQLLIEANPVPTARVPDAVRAELFAEVRRTQRPARARRGAWRWPLPSIVVGLVAAGGVATAAGYLISQQTRDRATALTHAPALRGADGPAVAYGADLKAAAERILATTPSPPGHPDRMDWAKYQPSGAAGERLGSMQLLIEYRAACRWRDYWLEQTASGHHAAAREAAKILRQAASWPGMRGDRGDARAIARRAARVAADGDTEAMRELSRRECGGSP